MSYRFKVGDPAIFIVSKFSKDPGPRAKQIFPAPSGDFYSYQVEKYWTVAAVHPNGQLRLMTRRGKYHDVQATDPRLQPARWWKKWLLRKRFPSLKASSNLSNANQG
jgi:hypothetical protein